MDEYHNADCLDVLRSMADNSVDAVVTDPPAGIGFMGKDWDKDKGGRDCWVAWMQEIAVECLRVLKPGGHALVWSLPRTSHWTAYAWENAGFEIRDNIIHIFGSGFPKSLDISKAIDKAAGVEREVIGKYQAPDGIKRQPRKSSHFQGDANPSNYDLTAPATEAAKQFEGFGAGLKPAHEDWWLLRKPLEKGLTIAENCLKYGTGGLSIDDCRVAALEDDTKPRDKSGQKHWHRESTRQDIWEMPAQGRFPANVMHDGSDEVVALFPDSNQNGYRKNPSTDKTTWFGAKDGSHIEGERGFNDTGSAARFFYCAKASTSERNEGLDGLEDRKAGGLKGREDGSLGKSVTAKNHHPTVKSVALMEYLIKMISREGQTVLDPFAGSGTTAVACKNLNRRCIAIEKHPPYFEIMVARVANATANTQTELP